MSIRHCVYFLAFGCLLALLCLALGSVLNQPAVLRWESQTREQDEMRAWLAMIGIRHLPLFLLAIVAGNVIFTLMKNATWPTAWLVSAPYLLYVFVTAIVESLEIGEAAFSWVGYQPSYFIWPHFVFVPAGLLAASRMVSRRHRQASA